MNRQDLQDLLDFAKARGLMQQSVAEVLEKFDTELKEWYEEQEADAWLSSMEAHDLPYIDAMV